MRHGSKTAAGDPNFDMSVRVLRQSVGLCNGPPSLNLRLARDWLTKLWFFSQKDPRRRIFPTIFLYAFVVSNRPRATKTHGKHPVQCFFLCCYRFTKLSNSIHHTLDYLPKCYTTISDLRNAFASGAPSLLLRQEPSTSEYRPSRLTETCDVAYTYVRTQAGRRAWQPAAAFWG